MIANQKVISRTEHPIYYNIGEVIGVNAPCLGVDCDNHVSYF
jgi:hypothetical protein